MIKQADFYNYCQFSQRSFEFTPGVNVIVGPNGSGKSTIMNGIYGVITGDWSRSSTDKQKNEDNIFWHAKEGERAGGRVTFTNGWVMERNIAPNSRKLTIPGREKSITKDGDIAKEFQDLFGVPSQVLRDYVMVKQELVKDVLTMTAQERLKMLIKAFQLDRFEAIYEALDKETTGDRAILSEARPDMTAIQQQRDKVILEVNEFNQLPPVQIPAVNVDALNKIIYGFNSRAKVSQDVDQALAEVSACHKTVMTITKVADDMKAEIEVIEKYVAENQADIDKYTKQVQVYDSTRPIVNAIVQSKHNLDIEIQTQAKQVRPAAPPGPARAELEAQLVTAREKAAQWYSSAKLSHDIRKLGTAVCPTCNQAITQAINPAAEAEYAKADQVVKDLEQGIRSHNYYDQQVAKFDADARASVSRQEMIKKQIGQYESQLQSSGAHEVTDALIAAIRPAVVEFNKMLFNLNSKRTTYQVACTSRENDTKSFQQAQARHAKLVEEFRALPNAGEAQRAEVELNAYNAAMAEDMKRKTTKIYLDKAMADADQSMKAAQEYIDSRARRKVWVDKSSILREAFHRNNVPRRILAKKLQGLQAATLDFLSNFVVPFVPVFTDSMDISCSFSDGKIMPVTRLSPGQTVALALSFRLAQHKAIAKNVDFLCLDEPSDGLDKNNRQRLNLMLPTLRAISQQNNVQFILITHDEIPEGIVDNVIRLRD